MSIERSTADKKPVSSMIRVCCITTGYPTHPACSRGIFIFRLIKKLVDLGNIHFDVITPAPSRAPEQISVSDVYQNSVTVRWFRYMVPGTFQILTDSTFLDSLRTNRWCIFLLPSFFLQFARKILYFSRKSDVIHCFWTVSALFPVFFKAFHKTPIILSVLGSDMAVIDKGLMKRVNNFIFKNVDQCIVLGEQQKDYVKDRTDRVETVPFGVDDELYYPIEGEEKKELRKRFGLSLNKIYVCYVGMFVPVKGLDLLIPVCRKLRETTDIDFQFLLIGEGNEKDRLFERIENESLQDYFLYAGNTACNETPGWVRASDISVSFSHTEGLSTALCEAAASGLPIVATRAGEIDTIVEHKVNGLIIESRNSLQFADALKMLMEDGFLRKEMGRKGTLRMKNFTSRIAARKMIGIYRDLIDKTKPSLAG